MNYLHFLWNFYQSLMLGMVIGGLFAFFKMMPPAPATREGILGVVGIYLGSMIIQWGMK